MSPEHFSPQEDSTSKQPEQQDPEQKMTKKDLEDLRTKIGERPEMSLPQSLRGTKDIFVTRQSSIWDRLTGLAGQKWTQAEITKYENLTGVLRAIEGAAARIEMEDKKAEKEDKGVDWFTGTMNLLREAEKLIADLEKAIQTREKDKEGETPWVTFEQEQRALWMQSMLTYGLPTDLLKDGKNPEIQTLAVPDNVSVYTVSGVDYQEVATPEDIAKGTAVSQYARKITQYRKLIHLKIPGGQTPVLKFEWTDASGQAMECTVTGRQRENGSWIFQMPQTEREEGGGRRGRRGRFR